MNDALLCFDLADSPPPKDEPMKGKTPKTKTHAVPNRSAGLKQRTISAGAHALASIGPITEAVVNEFLQDGEEPEFFAVTQEYLKSLAQALQGWSDVTASSIVREYIVRASTGNSIDIDRLIRWIRIHQDDLQSVLDCINIDPPSETEIISVLSRSGSHKLVFLATWRDAQKQVVLKRPLEPGSVVSKRESQSHPLSMAHPNIIVTHLLHNKVGDEFFVEEYIPDILEDGWRSKIQEAANLLHDIADALAYLHKPPLSLVHGDVKPDNIAKKDGRYILLDFGICRPAVDFRPEVTGTGSLRTRAPELLTLDQYSPENAQSVDVWALGATVYNALQGRFPLIDVKEPIPKITDAKARKSFEQKLAHRAEEDWSKWVDLTDVDPAIRPALEMALPRDPAARATAADLVRWAQENLSAFLRNTSHTTRFSPLDEINQLSKYLPEKEVLALMPITAKENLRNRLADLTKMKGLEAGQMQQVASLMSRLA